MIVAHMSWLYFFLQVKIKLIVKEVWRRHLASSSAVSIHKCHEKTRQSMELVARTSNRWEILIVMNLADFISYSLFKEKHLFYLSLCSIINRSTFILNRDAKFKKKLNVMFSFIYRYIFSFYLKLCWLDLSCSVGFDVHTFSFTYTKSKLWIY